MVSLAEWQARGRIFGHQGHPVYYFDDGQGEVLLLIHGFPTASWDWMPIWPALTNHFRCVAADMIGFGFSAKPYKYSYSIMDQADLQEKMLANMGIRKAHILAHDYGDTVAQELLARFLGRQKTGASGLELQSVCFLNGGLFPETHQARPVQKLLHSPLGPLISRLMNRRRFSQSFAAVFGPDTQPSAEEMEVFWQLVSRGSGTRIAHKLIRYIKERRQHRDRWVGALQASTIPLRLIDGALDPVSGRHMAERYEELVPNPDVVLLDRIGHYPQVESPAEVVKAFFEFHGMAP